jgi:hypothetical protein
MTLVGFEPTTPAYKRAKTVHALDQAATVIGPMQLQTLNSKNSVHIITVLFALRCHRLSFTNPGSKPRIIRRLLKGAILTVRAIYNNLKDNNFGAANFVDRLLLVMLFNCIHLTSNLNMTVTGKLE